MIIRFCTAALLLFTTTSLTACSDNGADTDAADAPRVYNYGVKNTDGQIIGSITLNAVDGGGVTLTGQLTDISPGEHGMHFHVKADCSADDFTSSGGHINPMGKMHGLNNPDGPDNADMPNAVADENGFVALNVTNPRVDLLPGGNNPALLDDDGSALVIHANPDDQVTQPIGGAGARIACAEIN